MSIPLHILSLGCARNEVDSEELAARFDQAGFTLVDEVDDADVVVVNTCGFIEAAKSESISEILGAAQSERAPSVIAVGCLAQRYGAELAESLPEADAVIGFDGYADIATRVRQVLSGTRLATPQPQDRRKLLPITPVRRAEVRDGPGWTPGDRKRLSGAVWAPLKIATGCDRRCAFCAIPFFRGAFQSRPRADVVAEARWLATSGVREVFLVSENTSSYGKDLPDPAALSLLLTDLSKVDGIDWIRLSYLQPGEVRPAMLDAIASTKKVVNYLDLPFQHGSASVLRRMRRFGDADSFLDLIARARQAMPTVGIRTNVIVGFPGETEADVEILTQFLSEAGLDAVGVFAYSDEEGTEGARLDGHLSEDEIRQRTAHVAQHADTVTALRAADRVGEQVSVLVETVQDGQVAGRSEQQGPDDGLTWLDDGPADLVPGMMVTGQVVGSDGVDWHLGHWSPTGSDTGVRMHP